MKLLDERAAAEYSGGLKPKTFANWRSQGTGPPFHKLGHRVFYEQADLDAWIARGRRNSTAEDFERQVESDKPPTVTTLVKQGKRTESRHGARGRVA